MTGNLYAVLFSNGLVKVGRCRGDTRARMLMTPEASEWITKRADQ